MGPSVHASNAQDEDANQSGECGDRRCWFHDLAEEAVVCAVEWGAEGRSVRRLYLVEKRYD